MVPTSSYCPEEALGSALSEAPANMRFAGAQKRILQLAVKQLDLLNFRTCGLKTQVFRTRVQDVETRVPGTLSLHRKTDRQTDRVDRQTDKQTDRTADR